MGQISLSEPVVGQPDATEDPKIPSNFGIIQTLLNGNLDATNVSAALAQSAGVNQAGQVVKGAVNIPTSQSTNSTTYVTLATPDQVPGLVLPTNGLICVVYKALISAVGLGTGNAALFMNANQLTAGGQGAPAVAETAVDGTVVAGHLVSDPVHGLVAMANTGSASSDVSTGQIVSATVSGGGGGVNLAPGGGLVLLEAAAGTYTVSVRYRVSVNTVTVTASNRLLRAWVWSPA